MNKTLQMVVSSLVICLYIGLIELLCRQKKLSRPNARKVIHVGVCLIVALLTVLFVDYKIFVLLGIVFCVLMFVTRYILKLESLSDRREASLGEVFLPLGVAISAVLATNQQYFVSSMLILGIADTSAYYFGKKIESPRLFFGKTLVGSVACLATTFIICVFVVPVHNAIAIAFMVSLCELISPYGSDNLTLPIILSAITLVL
ncbi:MAG: hypothetical protein H6793_00040 [Candidatus Nomurabacteria bacterium]|nr:hypothetical protein [Candidatus Saccharibacteria bacterium]USN95548.1 MAG: hypothetical protein H6793_00040 [Candidatus Nomurabacteria bacterium]